MQYEIPIQTHLSIKVLCLRLRYTKVSNHLHRRLRYAIDMRYPTNTVNSKNTCKRTHCHLSCTHTSTSPMSRCSMLCIHVTDCTVVWRAHYIFESTIQYMLKHSMAVYTLYTVRTYHTITQTHITTFT